MGSGCVLGGRLSLLHSGHDARFPTSPDFRIRSGSTLTKLFCFRFDVDTHRCVREGMPALSSLGERLGVPFTFFVNMGRAVSLGALLAARSSASASPVAAKYSARRKLGWSGYLHAALLNPEVGAGSHDVIREARRQGHEVGLHGGRNHAVWQREAQHWSRARIETEIDSVLPALTSLLGGDAPKGFASPGWTTSDHLDSVLHERGFRYLADDHGPTAPLRETSDASSLIRLRTGLTGEPGGVAYLEHLRAQGHDDDALYSRFERDLEQAGPVAVAYDHPYYAGLRELSTVERLVGIARQVGYQLVPMSVLAERSR